MGGGTLIQRINETPHLTESHILNYIKQVIVVLEYLHKNRLLHLDIKPANVVFTNRNSNTLKVIDLGMSRYVKKGAVVRGIRSTKAYMAPEMARFEEITPACDMWSLGIMTYHL